MEQCILSASYHQKRPSRLSKDDKNNIPMRLIW